MFKTLAYLILIIVVLTHPDDTFKYAYQGLYQWATRIVPTLFPFMMISSLMVYSGADMELGNLLNKMLKKLYKYSNYGLYAIFMGFFCGFPMGAKVVSDLYEQNKISKSEANTLIAFCNNIGPAYFMGIIIPILHKFGYSKTFPFIFGMYGIPAIYGVIIGLIYSKNPENHNFLTQNTAVGLNKTNTNSLTPAAIIKKSCIDNTQSLIILGGYITFTNAFRIFIDFIPVSVPVRDVMSAFIEITGGVQTIYAAALPQNTRIFWIMTALCFGGISCIMQTGSFLEKSGLSIACYIKHKLLMTFISSLYYLCLINIIC